MPTVLMIAEKPSLAQSLACILSNGNYRTRKAFNDISVYEYNGSFHNKNVIFKFTSVCGHIMGTDFEGRFKNWNAVEPHELFDVPIVKEEANPKLRIPQFLECEGRKCDYLILWLDCDKEGENICFEVIHVLNPVMQICTSGKTQNVFRAKFSAITEHDIKYAMNNLISPNELESLSVDARQELDLRIGCAFTRFQTQFFRNKYNHLDTSMISFGPCQTPTLAFCVNRYDEIESFKPQPFWVLNVTIKSEDKSLSIAINWERKKEMNFLMAQSYLNSVRTQKCAKITELSKIEKTKFKPIALNTVQLIKTLSSYLRIGPHHAMQIAERLYTRGYISYPRTETTDYPENFDLMKIIRKFSVPFWEREVNELLEKGIRKPRPGHDAGDHPPITPMKCAVPRDFDHESWKVYEYIVRYFFATVSGDMKYEESTIEFSIGSERFSKKGKRILEHGFTLHIALDSLPSDQNLPFINMKIGDEFLINDAKLIEKKTSPPEYLTESELISLMEKHGIGTDASIPTHINNICLRNYVSVTPDRRLIPTSFGVTLIHGYQKIDTDLALPTKRAEIEKELNEIALGRADYHVILQKTIEYFRSKFMNFKMKIHIMDKLYNSSLRSFDSSRNRNRYHPYADRNFKSIDSVRNYNAPHVQRKSQNLIVNADETRHNTNPVIPLRPHTNTSTNLMPSFTYPNNIPIEKRHNLKESIGKSNEKDCTMTESVLESKTVSESNSRISITVSNVNPISITHRNDNQFDRFDDDDDLSYTLDFENADTSRSIIPYQNQYSRTQMFPNQFQHYDCDGYDIRKNVIYNHETLNRETPIYIGNEQSLNTHSFSLTVPDDFTYERIPNQSFANDLSFQDFDLPFESLFPCYERN